MASESKTFRHKFPIWFEAKAKRNDKTRFIIETDLQGLRLMQALLEHYSWQIAADNVVKGLSIQKDKANRGEDA